MAVKAREKLENGPLSLPVLGLLLVVGIGYTFFYSRMINQINNEQLKTFIGGLSLMILTALFVLSLWYVVTNLRMTLTHDRLVIERKNFFVKKKIGEIMLSQVVEISPDEKGKKNDHKILNLAPLNLKSKEKYIIHYKKQGKIQYAKIQCSDEFYKLLEKQVKIV